ncbi:hypothetical protein SAMN05192558_113123 [Actinokineospora alba]|uniref:Uncharacterized protein n=1 Tax=Actinokineospora alba TaxID=504798 RepID=A0A1H0V9Y6_9PSEU|nr:hypothetical protein [Actinokineospora alba]TDP65570.1 hypothetical protein C8E96_1056 [Actinokineospora alba]SDH65651.1 hypothetical protein SAMN05421871_101877 [Actinokineospora alba]SDP75183.1 hypothetical protein SAMN05192558_113123 [Actinokineospora alba]
MIADEQDRTVARLRHELGAMDVHAHVDQVDRMLRRVHTRRREQRQHTVQIVAALAVVLIAVAGAFVVSWRPTEPDLATPAAPVVEWPMRGNLVGDFALHERAEALWRGAGENGPTGPVRTIYAGNRVDRTASMVVIAMVAPMDAGRSRVAFVTSAVSIQGIADETKLFLRSVTTVEPGQRAVGFIVAKPASGDEELRGGGAVGFALATPGATAVKFRSSIYDMHLEENQPITSDGAVWIISQSGVAAWNSTIEVAALASISVRLAPALTDASVEAVTLTTSGQTTKALGDVREGDLIVTPQGLVGVVGSDGTVDTRLTGLGSIGTVQIARSVIPGDLVERAGVLTFAATGPGDVLPGNRVVLANGDLVVNLGKIAADRLAVERMVDPNTVTTAMRVRQR